MWIQTGVTVRKRLSGVMTFVTLTFDLWPWPFTWASLLSMVIISENFMMIWWQEHSKKGVTDRRTSLENLISAAMKQAAPHTTDGRTNGRTDRTIQRAAWLQLKKKNSTAGVLITFTSDDSIHAWPQHPSTLPNTNSSLGTPYESALFYMRENFTNVKSTLAHDSEPMLTPILITISLGHNVLTYFFLLIPYAITAVFQLKLWNLPDQVQIQRVLNMIYTEPLTWPKRFSSVINNRTVFNVKTVTDIAHHWWLVAWLAPNHQQNQN